MEIYSNPKEIKTTENDWWLIFDYITKTIIVDVVQCAGYTTSPYTMVVCDSEENLNQYIVDNNLKHDESSE
jgi:hypothetical protein